MNLTNQRGIHMYLCKTYGKFIILSTVLIIIAGCESSVFVPEAIDRDISFRADVMPIMNQSCAHCHRDADDPPPNLSPEEDVYGNIMGGGYVIPGNAEGSLFYKRLIGDPDIKGGRTMPPREPLPQSEIDIIKAWIEQGAQNN